MARREPGSTLAIFVALALGIGGATAIFSVVNAVMLRPLPVRDGRALVRIYDTDRSSDRDSVSTADYLDWKRDLKSFSGMAAFANAQATLSGFATPERAKATYSEWTLLPLLGVSPIRGRNFLPIENQPGHLDEAILTYPFWQSHFGGANVIGRRILLDDAPVTIIGVLPANFTVMGHPEVLLPLTLDPKNLRNKRGFHACNVIARLAPGVSLSQANAELSAYAANTARLYPLENKGVSARAQGLAESLTGEGLGSAQKAVRPALVLLLIAILCVLAIACGNVANLNLIRALAREREIAVRVAIGASRWQLFRQVLTESLLLSLAASLAGLGLAAALIRILTRLPLNAIPRLDETSIDWRVLVFAIAVGCLTGIGFGLLPAIRSGAVKLVSVLKESGGRTSGTRRQGQLRQAFVAAEAALAALLLIQCGLFIKSFLRAASVDPGLAPDHLLTFYLALPPTRYGYGHPESTQPLVRGVLSRIRQVTGVTSAAAAADLPLSGTASGAGMLVEGRTRAFNMWDMPHADETDVSPGYFDTLRIRLIAGRTFAENDPNTKTAVVNETFARRFFPGESPLGQRIAVSLPTPEWHQIVGVAADVPPGNLEDKIPPEAFFPIERLNASWLGLMVRVSGDPLRYTASMRSLVGGMDPAIAVFLPRSMEQMLARQLFWRSLQTWLVAAFAALAVLLAAIGIYAVVAYSVSQRTSEIGIRMALGAPADAISRMILWQGARPAIVGVAIGCIAGLALARVTASLLFGTQARDAGVYAAASLLLVFIAVAASLLPAWRAAQVEPWRALRHE